MARISTRGLKLERLTEEDIVRVQEMAKDFATCEIGQNTMARVMLKMVAEIARREYRKGKQGE